MEPNTRNMQDQSQSEAFRQQPLKPEDAEKLANGSDHGAGIVMNVYTCAACRQVIARTEVAMEEEGLKSKMRSHVCRSPGKQDFERELR